MFIFEPKSSGKYWNLSTTDTNTASKSIGLAVNRVLQDQQLSTTGESSNREIYQDMYNAIHRHISGTDDRYQTMQGFTGPYSTLARKIIMTAGYDGIIDPGAGVIHINEPTQAIFFRLDQVSVLTMIRNKQQSQLSAEYHTPITTVIQWKSRLDNAIDVGIRDRDVEKLIGTFYREYLDLNFYDTYPLVNYARQVGVRIPKFEPFILKGTESNLISYAMQVIQGRWLEAEPRILMHPTAALLYAKDVIRGRWPEAEPIIKEKGSWAMYKRYMARVGVKI
jgi:hypothetical protein